VAEVKALHYCYGRFQGEEISAIGGIGGGSLL
jgi:hypothetical protein